MDMSENQYKTPLIGIPQLFFTIYSCLFLGCINLFFSQALANNLNLSPSFRFERFNEEDGFLNAQINVTLQDKFGYLWIGSAEGLSRYDGYEFEYYVHNSKDVNSLSGNVIEDIFEDSQGRIWVASWDGLDLYHRETNNFTRYNHDPDDPTTLGSPTVRAIIEDNQGILWLGRSGGLTKLNPDTNELTNIKLMEGQADDIYAYNDIASLTFDDQGDLWIGSWAAGMGVYRPESGAITWYQHDPQDTNSISSDYVWHVYFDEQGRIWVSTFGGLNRFYKEEKRFKAYRNDSNLNSISSNEVFQVEPGPDNKLWVATHHGLNLFDPEQEIFHRSLHSVQDKYSISDNVILDLHADYDGNLWISTFGGALSKLNWQYQQFAVYRHNPSDPNSMSGDAIASMFLDSQGNFWLGYRGKGLDVWDAKTGLKRNFSHQENQSDSLPFNDVTALYEDSFGNFWVGTDGRGLLSFDRSNESFTAISPPEGQEPPQYEMATVVLEYPKGTLWNGTWGGGLKRLEIGQDRYSRIYDIKNDDARGLRHRVITALAVWQGDLFIGTFGGGLYRYNFETDSFTEFRTNNSDLPGNYLVTLLPVGENELWIGTSGAGLAILEPATMTFQSIDVDDGLSGSQVTGLIEDSEGHIWTLTGNGLTRINPVTRELSVFPSKTGTLDYSDAVNTALLDDNGTLYFGSRNGMTRLTLDGLQTDSQAPLPVLNNISLNDEVLSGWHQNKGLLASDTPFQTLTYSENNLDFWFTAVHLARPKENQYQYQLHGMETQWRETNARIRKASYTNLSPGEYTFRLKTANHDGVWSEPKALFSFRITPPLWATWWAYSLYALLAILLGYGMLQFRTRTLRRQALELKALVAERTADLQAEKNKVEQLLSEKSAEFAVLSHELRTPLTLIIGPLKFLIDKVRAPEEFKASEASGMLRTTLRNASRLLRLVEHLLQLERIQHANLQDKRAIGIKAVINQTIETFQPIANEKGIKIKAENIPDLWAELVPDTLEKILSNLISNGIKYGKPGGKVDVCCYQKDTGQFHITVSDDGIGISKEEQRNVFLRYRRVRQDGNHSLVQGNGIGLSLVKELVEKEGGQIQLKSNDDKENSGSCITVTLPLCQEEPDKEALSSTDEAANLEIHLLQPEEITGTQPDAISEQVESQKPLILLVEDNPEMLSYLKQSLSANYHCILASDGLQGFELAQKHIPDLIISDVMMPEKDGFQLSKLIKETEITCHIPVVLLTAKSDIDSRLKGWQHYADEYLGKPFLGDELLLRVQNLLSIRDIIRNKFTAQIKDISPPATLIDVKSKKGNDLDIQPEKSRPGAESQGVSAKNKAFMEKLEKIIQQRFHQSELKVGDLALAMSVSDRQLVRKLKAIAGVTPNELLRSYRLQQAKIQLAEQEPVGNVAYNVGFSSHAYFSACFKAEFGIEPSVYANKQTDAAG